MKKVGIFTLNGYYNYGNRLQNYALQEVINSFGYQAETIVIIEANNKNKMNYLQKIKTAISKPSKVYKKVQQKIDSKVHKKIYEERTSAFKDFSRSHINIKTINKVEGFHMDFIDSYDFFVTGSDQVWNPFYINGSSLNFLTFAPKRKRIAYAPSFGISSIPSQYLEKYKEWISEMKSLSVRENAGADIIKKLTGRDAEVLVDPTMLLTKEKWLSISKQSQYKPNSKYILTYFLGKIPKEYKNRIKLIAEKNNMNIIRLNDVRDKDLYSTDPSEFIDFINDASLVCTDSFHGAVFSILLETPFIVFERIGKSPSMNSRLETLLSTFKLESRFQNRIKSDYDLFNVNFSHVGPILEYERKKSLNYLKKAFEIEKITL